MSQTHSLVCHQTRKSVWIGQGTGPMTTLYYGQKSTMDNLKRFLNDHRGQPLEFVCDDLSEYHDYDEYTDFGKSPPDDRIAVLKISSVLFLVGVALILIWLICR